MSPAPAGMIPASRSISATTSREPRTRGDDPKIQLTVQTSKT